MQKNKKKHSVLFMLLMVMNMIISTFTTNVFAEETPEAKEYGVFSVDKMRIHQVIYQDHEKLGAGWGGMLSGQFRIPANAQVGDYFTLKLPDTIKVLSPANPNKKWFTIKEDGATKVVADVYHIQNKVDTLNNPEARTEEIIKFVLTEVTMDGKDYEGSFQIGDEKDIRYLNGKDNNTRLRVGFVPDQGLAYDAQNPNSNLVKKEGRFESTFAWKDKESAPHTVKNEIEIHYEDSKENHFVGKGLANVQVESEDAEGMVWNFIMNSDNRDYTNHDIYIYLSNTLETYASNDIDLKKDMKIWRVRGAKQGGYIQEEGLTEIAPDEYTIEYVKNDQPNVFGTCFKIVFNKDIAQDPNRKAFLIRMKTKRSKEMKGDIEMDVGFAERGASKVAEWTWYKHFTVTGDGGASLGVALPEAPLTTIKLEKVDSVTKEVLEDTFDQDMPGKAVLFALSDQDGNYLRNVHVDNNGEIVVADLEIGKTYTLEEKESPENYWLDQKKYTITVKEDGYEIDGVTYTNENKVKIENEKLTDITVTKKWVGEKAADAEVTVKVKLERKGLEPKELGEVTLNDANNWTHTFKNLPNSKDITVEEVGSTAKTVNGVEVKRIEVSDKNYNVTYEGDAENGLTITNTLVKEPTTTWVLVTNKDDGEIKLGDDKYVKLADLKGPVDGKHEATDFENPHKYKWVNTIEDENENRTHYFTPWTKWIEVRNLKENEEGKYTVGKGDNAKKVEFVKDLKTQEDGTKEKNEYAYAENDYEYIETQVANYNTTHIFMKKPEAPVEPKQPEGPELPEQPEVPAVPEQPEVPAVPEQPEVPAVPEQPEVPTVPEQPEVPAVPEQPEVPAVPEQPEVPEVPEQPEVPTVPGQPEVPAVPEQPEVPAVPEQPEVPAVPEQPEVPTVPEQPDVPEVPKQPEGPVVPEQPVVPSEPEVPVVPEEPSEPVKRWTEWVEEGTLTPLKPRQEEYLERGEFEGYEYVKTYEESNVRTHVFKKVVKPVEPTKPSVPTKVEPPVVHEVVVNDPMPSTADGLHVALYAFALSMAMGVVGVARRVLNKN